MAEIRLTRLLSLSRRAGLGGLFTRNVVLTFAVQAISLVFGLATSAILARWLGPEGKGVVALALLVPSMLGLFLSAGLPMSNVYYAGSRRLDVPTLTANSVALGLVATLVGVAAIGGLALTGWSAKLLPGVATALILVALAEFPLKLIMGQLSGILQGLQRLALVNAINLVDYVATLVFTVLLVIASRLGAMGAVLASVVAVLAGFVITVVAVARLGGSLRPRWRAPVIRDTLSFGMRGYVGNVLQFFNYRLDMILVNLFLGPAGVGIYSVSVRIAELLWYLPNAVGFVIFPKAAATPPEAMNRFTPRVLRITLLLTVVGALVLFLVGKPLIQVVFSEAFMGAYLPMLALLPGVVLLGGAKVLTNEIAGRGYPHYNSINSGLSLVVTVILDLILIPRYQVLGASLASTAAYAVSFFTAVAFYAVVSRRAAGAAPV